MPTEQQSRIVPWHMWGETKSVDIQTDAAENRKTETQFARINYARPDTWSFVLAAQVVDHSGDTGPTTRCFVDFDISVGVGRSHVTLTNFAQLVFDFQGAPMIGELLWTNTAQNRVGASALGGPPGTITYTRTSAVDSIVAQDIQCKVRTALSSSVAARVRLDVHAFFAPKAHVRPEWWIRRFAGGEEKGS